MRALHEDLPVNLEGLFADSVFRWAAMHVPSRARWLAELDDRLGRGAINPVKKWWWDIELDRSTQRYVRARATHARGLNRTLELRYEDQTLAVYPADRMPPPFPVIHPADREEGISRYRAMLTPAEYRRRLADGRTDGLAPPFRMPAGDPPVFPVVLRRRVDMGSDNKGSEQFLLEFASLDGGPLPAFDAGAHIDVVIAPEYQRQYSLAGDPADRSRYLLGVQREPDGRGGSMLMHRVFREGRKVFVSRPVNHFALDETAGRVLLFAGGIGVTPLITMAHRLHALGRAFELHYSARTRTGAGFAGLLRESAWASCVHLHIGDEGTRADLDALVPAHAPGLSLYTCGSARYMDAVFAAAARRGWPPQALHREYFSVPDAPERVNLPFELRLARSARTVTVPADRSATDVLAEVGIRVDTKCSDGICGVCATHYDAAASSPIEHRDYVLSAAERSHRLILCCSRPQGEHGVLTVDL